MWELVGHDVRAGVSWCESLCVICESLSVLMWKLVSPDVRALCHDVRAGVSSVSWSGGGGRCVTHNIKSEVHLLVTVCSPGLLAPLQTPGSGFKISIEQRDLWKSSRDFLFQNVHDRFTNLLNLIILDRLLQSCGWHKSFLSILVILHWSVAMPAKQVKSCLVKQLFTDSLISTKKKSAVTWHQCTDKKSFRSEETDWVM